ncbi:potassium channel family protein [Evansella cellulosilytica]|uniref:Ion transport 2 domain protein n=1 Tax=Evansella cellulosilytica (strain ATCC 21833 / DSM 2522 / FERM P-1141 / JCM 9156 / N-4) TaxID=649639 RepID=E6U219_EVAC2|nr:potassium channel family protein [Evansella cellulosilytica]ADU29263.1 Ion transport 2 domain protein [Evansella cellulosilytica DSM 2522]
MVIENLFMFFVISVAIVGVFMSLYLLLKNQPVEGRRISLRNFIVLILVYVTVMTGFGVLYLGLELSGIPVLTEGGSIQHASFFHLVEDVMYFSAVTLLTVGYGDITPMGVGRWIAMIQALIGYLLPAAFVVTTVFYRERRARQTDVAP